MARWWYHSTKKSCNIFKNSATWQGIQHVAKSKGFFVCTKQFITTTQNIINKYLEENSALIVSSAKIMLHMTKIKLLLSQWTLPVFPNRLLSRAWLKGTAKVTGSQRSIILIQVESIVETVMHPVHIHQLSHISLDNTQYTFIIAKYIIIKDNECLLAFKVVFWHSVVLGSHSAKLGHVSSGWIPLAAI